MATSWSKVASIFYSGSSDAFSPEYRDRIDRGVCGQSFDYIVHSQYQEKGCSFGQTVGTNREFYVVY